MNKALTYTLCLLAALLTAACDTAGSAGGAQHFTPFNAQNQILNFADKGVETYSCTTDWADSSMPSIRHELHFLKDGRLDTETYGDDQPITYTYAGNGRLINISNFDNFKATYNSDGDLIEIYGIDPNYGGITQRYTYDSQGRVIRRAVTYDSPDYRAQTYDVVYRTDSPKVDHTVTTHDGAQTITTDYDSHGLPKEQVTKTTSGETLQTLTYTHATTSHGHPSVTKTKIRRPGYKAKPYYTETNAYTYYDTPYSTDAAAAQMTAPQAATSSALGKWWSGIKWRYSVERYKLGGASTIMLWILGILTLAIGIAILCAWAGFYINKDQCIFHPGWNIDYDTSLRKSWYYCAAPYKLSLETCVSLLAGFIIAILCLMLVGGLLWGLMWLLKGLMWCLYYAGWIAIILGGLALFAKEGAGCLPLIIGIVIVSCEKWIERTGEAIVAWGERFFDSANFFGFGYSLIVNFGDLLLLIFLAPLLLFLAVALTAITAGWLMRGAEWAFTKIYRINRPCPQCGQPADYDYIIDGYTHPEELRPSRYGLFHHTRMITPDDEQYTVPTLIANGRERLDRRCRACGAMITADGTHSVGRDIHIGFVGHVGAGKSYLMYSCLDWLNLQFGSDIEQVDLTDPNLNIAHKARQIASRQGIQTDRRAAYRAVQMMLKQTGRPVPYHLYFYDVAGEQFTSSAATAADDAMRFYRNVESIIVVIDPLQTDLTAPGMNPSPQFEAWQRNNSPSRSRYDVAEMLASVCDYLDRTGRDRRKVDLTFVTVKTGTGYYTALNYPKTPTEADIERFLKTEMGLSSLVNSAHGFHTVSYYATDLFETGTSKQRFTRHIMSQRGINIPD